ncbi:MAG: TolC family protein [Bacteroidales bacterium]
MKTLKMYKQYLLTLLMVLCIPGVQVQAQPEPIHLRQLIDALHTNHPFMGRTEIYQEQLNKEEDLLDKQWLPDVKVQGQATWQSEVTGIDMDIAMPGVDLSIPGAPKDQYRIAMELQQTLYDGGRTRLLRNVESARYQGYTHAHEMDLHSLEQQVTALYFGGLQMAYQEKQLDLKVSELQSRLEQLEAGVKHGVLLPSEMQTLQAEKLKLEQQLLKTVARQKNIHRQLSLLTGLETDTDRKFVAPELVFTKEEQWQRPVFRYLESQQAHLQAQQQLTKAANRPQVFGFAQAGYGNPGLNMLNDGFNDFYLVGLKFSWQLWDWQKGDTQRALLDKQRQLVALNEKDMKLKFRQQLSEKTSEIERLEKALQKDEEIIALRKSIYKEAAGKLRNGTLTATDYLAELNAVADAQLGRDLRNLYLLKNKVEYLQILGVPLSEMLVHTVEEEGRIDRNSL